DEAKANLIRVETQLKYFEGQERTLDTVARNLEAQVEGMRFARGGPERVTADLEAMRDEVAQTEQVLKKIGDELGTLAAESPSAGRITLLEAAEVPTSRNLDRQLKAVGAAGFDLGAAAVRAPAGTLVEAPNRLALSFPDGSSRSLPLPLPVDPAAGRRIVPGR